MMISQIRNIIWNDMPYAGLRITVGVLFIAHSLGKFEPGFANAVTNWGLPAEMAIPIALAEFVPGVLLIMGVLSRIASALLSVVMVGAIFYIHKVQNLTGDGGYEFALVLLAASLLFMVRGSGRISFAHLVQKLPKVLQ